jgi:N-acetylglucosamine kinase-like BadF-type ATPase
MRLIIDAGSTKMGWILMEGHEVKAHFVTKGFNPNYSDRQDLENIVSSVETQCFASQKNVLHDSETQGIASLQHIFYYGTGCGNEQNCQIIKEVFQNHFPNAEIHVTHDLMAVCHAVLGHEKGIACILGTGSNSCVYDGKDIVERAVSLGYLVGDEGSGMHIGREVVRAYFYGFLPEELRQKFDSKYHLELKDFIQQLYHVEQPSKYLASFAKFAGEHQNHPFIHELVKDCFNAFIGISVCRYVGCETMKVCFIGSVAYHFKDILKECLAEYGLTMGEVMPTPAEGLIRYYQSLLA